MDQTTIAVYTIFLGWTIMSILVGFGIGHWVFVTKKGSAASEKSGDINKLINEVRTEKNEGEVNQLVKYHNNRVRAGADRDQSLKRLTKDLERVKRESQDESRSPE